MGINNIQQQVQLRLAPTTTCRRGAPEGQHSPRPASPPTPSKWAAKEGGQFPISGAGVAAVPEEVTGLGPQVRIVYSRVTWHFVLCNFNMNQNRQLGRFKATWSLFLTKVAFFLYKRLSAELSAQSGPSNIISGNIIDSFVTQLVLNAYSCTQIFCSTFCSFYIFIVTKTCFLKKR